MRFLRPAIALSVALLLAAPVEAQEYFDELNGLWVVTLDGETVAENALTESYPQIGVRMRFQGQTHSLKRVGDRLVIGELPNVGIVGALDGETPLPDDLDVNLEIKGLDTKDPADDTFTGTFFGKTAKFERDVRTKPPIEITLPGDRPWVRFMQEILIPKTAEDRETYHDFNAAEARKFLRDCQLYRTGYWQHKYMKGATKTEQSMSFDNIVRKMHGAKVSPRTVLKGRFVPVLSENLSEKAKPEGALAASSLGMYFSTAAGGAVRIVLTDNRDSIVYYITDRRRTSKLGLVVMKTPTHAPLASSFGKWHLDFAETPLADDEPMARAILETMVKSSSKAANELSPIGRSAYTDYLGVMAIEDQRGVMFNNASLNWGYNMTNACFATLVSRALSHGEYRTGPEALGSKQELASKVIVDTSWIGSGGKLQPGDASYWDVLNGAENVLEGGKKGGNDLQERGGMATMKKLTTSWLKEKHPELVARVEASLAPVRPASEISSRARADIFHLMCENFYDVRMSNLAPEQAEAVVEACLEVLRVVKAESRDLEAYMLGHGVTASDEWAPRASGF